MSLQKISGFWKLDSKGLIAATAVVALGSWIFYKIGTSKPKQEEKQNIPAPKQQKDIKQILTDLKQKLDLNNISTENMKKILTMISQHVKVKSSRIQNNIKQDRRKRFPKQIRLSRLAEYFKYTSDRYNQQKELISQLQAEQEQLIGGLGLNQDYLRQFTTQNVDFMKDLMLSKQFTVQNTRTFMELKIDYLTNHGDKLITQLIQLAVTLSIEQKQFVPICLMMLINDQVYEQQPQFDTDDYEIATQLFNAQLQPQIIKLQKALMPLMGRLQISLLGDQIGDFSHDSFMAHEDDNSLNDSFHFSERKMQEQIEHIKRSDPKAYEQLMAMMQTQMST